MTWHPGHLRGKTIQSATSQMEGETLTEMESGRREFTIDPGPIPDPCRLPLPRHFAGLLVHEGVRGSTAALRLVRSRRPVATPVLRAGVSGAVVVVVAEIPRLSREDGVTAASTVHFLTGVDPLVPAPPPGLVR
jgi:hypothetical protein